MKDISAVPATSVLCERLFSAGVEIATDRWSCLGPKLFEQLQVLKHTWHSQVVDFADSNSNEVDEIEVLQEFRDMLDDENEQEGWEVEVVVVD